MSNTTQKKESKGKCCNCFKHIKGEWWKKEHSLLYCRLCHDDLIAFLKKNETKLIQAKSESADGRKTYKEWLVGKPLWKLRLYVY